MTVQRTLVTLMVAGLLATSAASALADGIKKLAVASGLGDELTVVIHRPESGSHIDRNDRQPLELQESVFDPVAAAAAVAAVRRAQLPLAAEVFDLGRVRAAEASSWVDDKRFTPPADLRQRLGASGFSHLMLIIRHRGPSSLKLAHSSVGSGKLEGIGFYIDRGIRVRRSDTGEVGQGFLAPYAYFQVLLINLENGSVEKSESVSASTSFSAARNKDGVNPWDALDAKQKIASIHRLLRVELNRVVPDLLR